MEAPSDVQTDSGVSSASSETEQREAKKTETLPPPSGNIKRYFHTIRSTPLPKSKSRLPVAGKISSVIFPCIQIIVTHPSCRRREVTCYKMLF